jgi:site-specific recombinase XerD
MTPLRQRMMEDMKIRNMSLRTQECYLCQISKFAKYFKKSPEELGLEEIRQYQLYLVEKKTSWSVFNQTVAALRFLYLTTLEKDWRVEQIPFPKQPKRLPVILSVGEVSQLLKKVKDYRYRVVLTTIYGCGLRLLEGTHLKINDIDSKRMVVRIEQGKGSKDRYVMLSPKLLQMLRQYFKTMHPEGIYLFPSKANADKPIHESAVQRAFQKALKGLRWKKPVSVRTLRHCFATHLLEAGMNLKTIQELMGHSSFETTQIYLHVSRSSIQNLSSPLDLLTDF